MAERVQLNESDLDSVVGGAFNFYNRNGKTQCYVDGVGTFYCSDSASAWIIEQVTGSSKLSPSDVAAAALEKGLFWK